ncbi:glycerol-3-phosphate acyltransferase [Herpetosiphon giganteus]|uniref:glycerol-3-phosphate acyltransferase n=1 Tax=Herpetosiphon giganteus TaxID=2029754 RepID=UPI00195BFE70|nr:glycerol-3-phosphate acyltransferase [Herpetosiphon giganteus]MBM7846469.1 glycerol-3-phosphate acyltransferase PlsY [Herpetosiphon giganteus]
MQLVLLGILGYLIGGIPFAVPVVRLLSGHDVRSTGSGNVGARNSLRVAGAGAGVLVLVLDALKSAIPMLLTDALFANKLAVAVVGVAAVLGHCYSPYLLLRSFKTPWQHWRHWMLLVGGQGLATGLGVISVFTPILALPLLAVGAFFALVLKRSSWAALVMISAAPIAAYLLGYGDVVWLSIAACAIIILTKLWQDYPFKD